MKRQKIVTGEYSATGYSVCINGSSTYNAGNHAQDSQAGAPIGSPEALPLRKLRSFCVRTCRDIADEVGGAYQGVTRL